MGKARKVRGFGGRAVLAACALVGLLGAGRPAGAEVTRQVLDTRLASGLRVVICPDPAAPDVTVRVRYDTGSRDEPAGLEGLAHLTEHLMFEGSRHVAHGELVRRLDDVGASDLNAETAIDSTQYHETIPSERLALALWLESDRMGYPLDRLDEAALARDRAAVLNEYRDRVKDSVGGETGRFLLAELFPSWHPYHHPPSGTRASIAALTLADARAFAGTWYGPANASLVIAGNTEAGVAAALAERYFGSLPPRPPPVRPLLPSLPPRGPVVLHVGAAVTRATVEMAWVTPALRAPGDVELDLAAAILAGRDFGRLERALFGAPRLAVTVSARQASWLLASVFSIRAVVADGRRPEEVVAAIDEVLGRFDAEVTEADVQRARGAWYNTKLFGLETSGGWATRLAYALPAGLLGPTFDGQLGDYAAITPDRVRAAVRAFLGRAHRTVFLVEPTNGAPISGALLRRSEGLP